MSTSERRHSRRSAAGAGRKRAYRYRVTGSEGSGTKAIGDSPYVLDWKYLGRSYSWLIFDSTKGEETGFFSGEYVDRGYVDAVGYKSDAELASLPLVSLPDPEQK